MTYYFYDGTLYRDHGDASIEAWGLPAARRGWSHVVPSEQDYDHMREITLEEARAREPGAFSDAIDGTDGPDEQAEASSEPERFQPANQITRLAEQILAFARNDQRPSGRQVERLAKEILALIESHPWLERQESTSRAPGRCASDEYVSDLVSVIDEAVNAAGAERVAAELAIADSGIFRSGSMLLSHIPESDGLTLIERGWTDDGIEDSRTIDITADAQLLLDDTRKHCIGFRMKNFSEIDFGAPESEPSWRGPRFSVPQLDLQDATVGLVAATARIVLRGLQTPNRLFFHLAMEVDGEEALALWERCLVEGDERGRYAMGYTLLDLGRVREAHEHLRHYARLVQHNAWAWHYLGQACEALEDFEGAEYAYRRAIEEEAEGSFETDAEERLASLIARRATES